MLAMTSIEKLPDFRPSWVKAMPVKELVDNLKIALRHAEATINESCKADWLRDAKAIKKELKDRGINWLRAIKE